MNYSNYSKMLFSVCGALAVAVSANSVAAADSVPAHVQAAVSDKGRPEADTVRDENRKPADVVAFARIKPGDKIADLLPGGGYFTRIFSKVVGAKGKVYALVPKEAVDRRPQAADRIKGVAAEPGYGNIEVLIQPIAAVQAPEPLDVIWTSDNYHDLKIPGFGADTAAMDKAIFAALKPGGIFLVIDHAAEAGSGARDSATLHRVDPELVKQEVTAAGFVLEAQSEVLRNAADDHKLRVQDGSIRGKTDQFVYRFRKPAK